MVPTVTGKSYYSLELLYDKRLLTTSNPPPNTRLITEEPSKILITSSNFSHGGSTDYPYIIKVGNICIDR